MATPSFHRSLVTINELIHNIMNNIIFIIVFGTLRSSSPRWCQRRRVALADAGTISRQLVCAPILLCWGSPHRPAPYMLQPIM